MRETIEIGATPHGEDCAQVGAPDYAERARRECRAYINQLKRMFGEPPEGCSLRVKSFSHDFGSYHEVVAVFDDENEEAAEYAYRLESDGPEYWDAEAQAELQAAANRHEIFRSLLND